MKKCIICGGQWHYLFKGRDILYRVTDKKFKVCACNKCGLQRTFPLISQKEIASYYPARYYSYNALTQKTILKRLKSFIVIKRVPFAEMYFGLPQKPVGKNFFLDVGCGDGEIVRMMNSLGWNAVGFEVGTKSSFRDKIYRSPHFTKTHFGHRFDCIRIWSVIEHVSDPRKYLEKVHALLNDDGVVYVCLPNTASINARIFRQFWYSLDVPRHQFGFNLENFTMLLDETGFKVISYAKWDNYFLNSLGNILSVKFPVILSMISAIFYRGDTMAMKIIKK